MQRNSCYLRIGSRKITWTRWQMRVIHNLNQTDDNMPNGLLFTRTQLSLGFITFIPRCYFIFTTNPDQTAYYTAAITVFISNHSNGWMLKWNITFISWNLIYEYEVRCTCGTWQHVLDLSFDTKDQCLLPPGTVSQRYIVHFYSSVKKLSEAGYTWL